MKVKPTYEELEKRVQELEKSETKLKIFKNKLIECTEDLEESQRISHVGSWKIDLTKNILTWSDEAYIIFGCNPHKFSPTVEAFLSLVHPDDRDAVEKAYFSSVNEGREGYEIEHRILLPDTDEIRYLHENCFHKRDKNGTIILSIGTVQDITERKLINERLLANEKELKTRLLYESAVSEVNKELILDFSPHDPVIKSLECLLNVSGASRVYIFRNNFLEEEISMSQIYEISAFGVKSESDNPTLQNLSYGNFGLTGMKEILSQNKPLFGKIKDFHPEERVMFESQGILSILLLPIFIDTKWYGFIGFDDTKSERQWDGNDIRLMEVSARSFGSYFGRKEAQEKLSKSEKRFKDLAEFLPESLYETNINGTLTFANRIAFDTFKHTYEDFKDGISPLDLLIPDDRDRVFKNMQRLMKGEEIGSSEYTALRKDGSTFPVLSHSSTIIDNGKIVGLRGIVINITDRKRAEEEIKNLNETLEKRVLARTYELKEAINEMGAFSYSVSHDLRAPLRHIRSYADLLNERFKETLPDKAKQYLNTITASSKEMDILINDLLKFSMNSRKELQKTQIDMNNTISEVIEKLKMQNKDKKISWIVSELPDVFGDYSLLQHVWMNLLENAVKYTRNKDEARIEVGFTRETDQFVFFVCDNGVGFDMRYAQNLFGVFQRMHPESQFEGSGIGLANVKRIVRRHGGRVWAEAKVNKGAKFYFTLPFDQTS